MTVNIGYQSFRLSTDHLYPLYSYNYLIKTIVQNWSTKHFKTVVSWDIPMQCWLIMESLSYINVTILWNYSGIGRAYTKWEDTVQAVNTASAAHAQAVDIMPPGLY